MIETTKKFVLRSVRWAVHQTLLLPNRERLMACESTKSG